MFAKKSWGGSFSPLAPPPYLHPCLVAEYTVLKSVIIIWPSSTVHVCTATLLILCAEVNAMHTDL